MPTWRLSWRPSLIYQNAQWYQPGITQILILHVFLYLSQQKSAVGVFLQGYPWWLLDLCPSNWYLSCQSHVFLFFFAVLRNSCKQRLFLSNFFQNNIYSPPRERFTLIMTSCEVCGECRFGSRQHLHRITNVSMTIFSLHWLFYVSRIQNFGVLTLTCHFDGNTIGQWINSKNQNDDIALWINVFGAHLIYYIPLQMFFK